MDEPSEEAWWRRLRHDLRGAYHQIRLCIDALEAETDPQGRLQWLDYIETAAERCTRLAAEVERAAPASDGDGRSRT